MEIKSVTTSPRSPSNKIRRISGSKNSDEVFFVEDTTEVNNTEMLPMSAVVNTRSVDSLFLLLGKQKSPYQKEVAFGNLLLDELEFLRIGLLSGSVPKNILHNLSSITKKNLNSQIDDENLKNLLKEIETRAKVELAKIEKTGNNIT